MRRLFVFAGSVRARSAIDGPSYLLNRKGDGIIGGETMGEREPGEQSGAAGALPTHSRCLLLSYRVFNFGIALLMVERRCKPWQMPRRRSLEHCGHWAMSVRVAAP